MNQYFLNRGIVKFCKNYLLYLQASLYQILKTGMGKNKCRSFILNLLIRTNIFEQYYIFKIHNLSYNLVGKRAVSVNLKTRL